MTEVGSLYLRTKQKWKSHTEASIVSCHFIIKMINSWKNPFKLWIHSVNKEQNRKGLNLHHTSDISAVSSHKFFTCFLPFTKNYWGASIFNLPVHHNCDKNQRRKHWTPMAKRARNSKSYTKRDGVGVGIVWTERSKGCDCGGVLNPFSLFSRGRTVQMFTVGWQMIKKCKSSFQWCTVQRGILITVDWRTMDSACLSVFVCLPAWI